MNNRLKHIDVVKGIGILLIVLAHNHIFDWHNARIMLGNYNIFDWHKMKKLLTIIYSFHIPLFLFLSGLFFKADGKFTELILSKMDSLIKPYFTTLIIWFFVQKNSSFLDYFVGIIYSSGWTIPNQWIPLWFLTHLWAVMIFSWLFIKVTKLNFIKISLQLFLLLCLLFIGVMVNAVFWTKPLAFKEFAVQLSIQPFLLNGLPFSMDILFITGFFFLLGFLFKQEVINFRIKSKYSLLFLVIFSFCHYYFNYTISLFNRSYGHPIISTLEAISGIYIVLLVSALISKYQLISQIFAYIGSGSLFILIFHGFFQSQSYDFLKSQYGVNYFPEICSFIIGCGIPLLMWELIKRNDYLSLFFLPLKYNKIIIDKK